MNKTPCYIQAVFVLAMLLLAGCYSNNCPLENQVLCNYYFFDSEGTAITYADTITVTTLKPGYKTIYTYRKLGNSTVTKEVQDADLISQGYTETISQQRNDTILMNRVYNVSSISLPMSYFNKVDTLVFSYGRISLKDTIYLRQESYPNVDLPECGVHRFHSLESVQATDAAIDHIEISNPTVNYEGNENIHIFFNGVVE